MRFGRFLGAVKSEFGKFGGVMDKLKKQLNTAANTVDETGVRTRAMERKLRTVEELPSEKASVQIDLRTGYLWFNKTVEMTKEQQAEIYEGFGKTLEWNELPNHQSCWTSLTIGFSSMAGWLPH